MKNNNQKSFSFSYSDWRAEVKTFTNPFDDQERIWLAFAYKSKSGYDKIATFRGKDCTPERLATIFDLLSVSTSCSEVVSLLSWYDFETEKENGEIVKLEKDPLYTWILRLK